MIPTYTELLDRAMAELRAQNRDGEGPCGLCCAINRAEISFERASTQMGFEHGYRSAMRHTLIMLVWAYGKRSRKDSSFLHPVPGNRGWKAERMRILRAMKRDFKGR